LPSTDNGRARQRYRTRKDLLQAAAALLREGQRPTMEAVAEQAMVSRATAYRYFPNIEALLLEAPLDFAVPDPAAFFADDSSTDPVARLDRAEAALHEMIYANEMPLRHMLARTVLLASEGEENSVPVRQNRRLPLIEAALAPARSRLDKVTYQRLCAALALVFGPEAMIVFCDVLRLAPRQARDVKRWMVQALVEAATAGSTSR
jgi:AcrR family transcriptional regulator